MLPRVCCTSNVKLSGEEFEAPLLVLKPTFAFAVNGRRALYDRDGCANPVRLHRPAISYT